MPVSVLDRAAAAIADGLPVDWSQAVSGASGEDERARLAELRLIASIAGFHTTLHSSFRASGHAARHPAEPPPGTWGPLRVERLLGRGAYGDVYRAWDPRLDRAVALKLIRGDESQSDERGTAVIEEGRLQARVRHPGVVTIYGADRIDRRVGLWMELVEGGTLESELRERGPLPEVEVVEIALELCSALEAVHGAGLLHRDIKTQNVMRSADGRLVLGDFGTGRPFDDAEPSLDAQADGPIAGTPLYLAPELFVGQRATIQSDLYSLGVLLYHLATGSYPVGGRTVGELRAAHRSGQRRPLREQGLHLSSELVDAIDRLLDPDPSRRPTAVGEFAAPLRPVVRHRPGRKPWVAAAAVLAALASIAIFGRPASDSEADFVPQELTVALPSELALPGIGDVAAVSPDGRDLVYVGQDDDGRRLYRRPLGQLDAAPIPDTEGATAPFFSPDGEWLGYLVIEVGSARNQHPTEVRRVRLSGGPAEVVAALPDLPVYGGASAAWADDDTIWIGGPEGLFRVPATGGAFVRMTTPNDTPGALGHSAPRPLPGGEAVLYLSNGEAYGSIAAYEPETDTHRIVIERAWRPWFVPSGHLVFSRADEIWAVPFDPEQARVTGEAVPVLDEVRAGFRGGLGGVARAHQLVVGGDGTLAYVPAVDDAEGRALVLVNGDGEVEELLAPPWPYSNVRLSPDGRRIAFETELDLYLYDRVDSIVTQLTNDGVSGVPLWSRDGSNLFFGSLLNRGGLEVEVFRMPAGGGEGELLYSDPRRGIWPLSWASDGSLVVGGWDLAGETLYDLGTIGDGSWQSIADTASREYFAAVAPGGRWIAYGTHEPHSRRVVVEPFPNPTGRQLVVGSGIHANGLWSQDGRRLFYRDRDREAVMAVPFDPDASEPLGEPVPLFSDSEYYFSDTTVDYAVAPDGRFLMIRDPNLVAPRQINIVRNWAEQLSERVR